MYFLFLLISLSELPNSGALLQQGLAALQQGHLQQARESLEAASKLDPKNSYVWTSLAETYLRLKDRKRASTAADNAEKVGSKDPVVFHALAVFYAECDEFRRAAQFEERFAESPKSDPEASARAADLYLNGGDIERGLVLARKSVAGQISPAHEDLLGRALIASGQLTAGTEHLRSAVNMAPTDSKIAFDWAQVLLRKEEFGSAADALGPALQAHPVDPQLILAMGVARYGQRRFEECVVLFLSVIKLDPLIEQPYTFIGRIIDQAGSHLSEITEAYRAHLVQQPRNANACVLLAKAILASAGNNEEAETLLRRSISIDSRSWEAHYELGALLLKKRDYRGALAEFVRSINSDPTQPAPHYQLARVYDRLGEPEKAKAEREIHEKISTSIAPISRP